MDVSREIRDRLARDPDDRALEIDGAWHSWGEIAAVAATIEDVLTAAGIGPEQPVGLIARNRLAHIAAMLQLFASRRCIYFIHGLLPPDALAAEFRKLNLPAIIAGDEVWAKPGLIAAARQTGTMGIALSLERGVVPVTGIERPGAAPHLAAQPDIAVEMLTSGTTGLPKRVPIDWRTVNLAMADAKALADKNFRDAATPPVRIHYVPLGNMSGVWQVLNSVLDGSPMVVLDKFDIARWADAIVRYRPKYAGLVPAAIKMVLDSDVPVDVFDSVQIMNVGGAKLDADVQARFEEKYGVTIITSYGASEFFGAIATWSVADRKEFGDRKAGSTGRARPGTELRIVEPDSGAVLGSGEVGLLEVRVERMGLDWIRTTDLAELDGDGFLYIRGRSDGAINRGGFKVHPFQVAEALCSHPAVADAAVVGVADDRVGEVPVAAVELLPDAVPPEEGELETFLRARLTAYQVPARILVVAALPRTQSLKVSVPDVKALFAA